MIFLRWWKSSGSAIEAFVSQTRLIDYAPTILGLNQYRSMVHLCGKGYAEAFLETTAEEYRRLFDEISLRKQFEPRERAVLRGRDEAGAGKVGAWRRLPLREIR